MSTGALPSTGLNYTSFSKGPSFSPLASTSLDPSVVTSTPARISRARLPRNQLNYEEPESLLIPSIIPSIQAPSMSPSLSPSAAHQPGPAQPLLHVPIRHNATKCMDSCDIRKELLRPVDEVLILNAQYRILSKASTSAVMLARRHFFVTMSWCGARWPEGENFQGCLATNSRN